MLEQMSGVRVVSEAGSSGKVLSLYRERKVNVVILDFQLPDVTGLEVSRKLLRRNPDARILVMSAMEGELLPQCLLER